MLLKFLIYYIIPLSIINIFIYLFIKKYKSKCLTHFYIYIFVEILYLISNGINLLQPSFYNHFVHLADAMLHGRLYLNFTPPYHDIVFYNNHVYIAQPILTVLLMMPFVFIYGITFNDIIFTIILGALNSAILYNILINLNKNINKELITKKITIFLTFFFAFGTVHWSVVVRGTVWHTSQVATLFFLLLAVNETLNKRRFFLIGIFAGTAIAARPSVYWAFPFFIIIMINDYLIKKEYKKFLIELLLFLIPYFIWALILGFFNYIRFGNIFEFGLKYMKHAAQLTSNLNTYGSVNLYYLKDNLNIAFLKFFKIVDKFPYIIPPPEGISIFVVSPLLIYMFRCISKDSLKLVLKKDFKSFIQRELISISAIIAVVCTAIPLLLYFNSGWVQFGYRYILDYIPFLIILMALGLKGRISNITIVLWIISILVNLYGMIIYMHFNSIVFQ